MQEPHTQRQHHMGSGYPGGFNFHNQPGQQQGQGANGGFAGMSMPSGPNSGAFNFEQAAVRAQEFRPSSIPGGAATLQRPVREKRAERAPEKKKPETTKLNWEN